MTNMNINTPETNRETEKPVTVKESIRSYCDLDEITQAVDRATAIVDLLRAGVERSKDGNSFANLRTHTALNALFAIQHELETIDDQLCGSYVKGIGYRWAAED